ncbi:MAG: diaminopimelate epimerase [Candidatus Nomurabacteria bacterium]|nr:diaminopimelate epimerase [Candidatus Nomurabacteria bacterium]
MIEFYKYHGAGNDFIMIDNREGHFGVPEAEKVKLLCDRHFGIGGDGVILLESSKKADSAGSPQADCFMNYYNADGTLAEMCGNGVRCTAKFFLEQTKAKLKELQIDTRAGIKEITCNNNGSFSVNMGAPVFSHADFPNSPLVLENIEFSFVSMGNPHAVGFVKNVSDIDISQVGPKIENNSHFPNKINVEFVEKVSDNYFKVKVWERGCGATLACGTGACAVYAILKNRVRQDLTQKEITLEFPGGKLYLSENEKGEIILRGEAQFVFKGEIE